MSDWDLKLLRSEVERVLPLAAGDPDLRDALRALARSILDATAAEEVVRPDEPLHELTLGRARPAEPDPPARPAADGAADEELPGLEQDCRDKAGAASAAAERLRRSREGNADGEDPDGPPEAAAWAASLADRLYWSTAATDAAAADVALIDDLAGNYEALADALALATAVLGRSKGDPKGLDRVLPLLAETQAGLRAAVAAIDGADEPEQIRAFEWVKETAARRRCFLKRFMRAGDLPGPSAWPERLARIDRELSRARPDRPTAQSAAIEMFRRSVADLSTEDSWGAVFEGIGAALAAGVAPSAREFREALLPVLDALPDHETVPEGAGAVLREIDRYLATRPGPPADPPREAPTAGVLEAARLLAGRSVLLIGGKRRPEAQKALRSALGLKELVWLETKEHQSVSTFEPLVARPDVSVVLLAIRWASHGFADVKPYCDRHGKFLVRLPAGYNPNQVAAQVLTQCGDRLSELPGV